MIFFASLIFIILIHELGHFWVANLCKCTVTQFGIGFGKTLFKKQIGDTLFKINIIPLGGYCALKDELTLSDDSTSFTNKTYWQQVAITMAGIFMNLLTGIPALLIGYNYSILWLWLFGYYSILIGLTNLLPIPALDGSFPIFLLFEKKLGKEKLYLMMNKVFGISFKILMILNLLCIPYMIYLLYKGVIL